MSMPRIPDINPEINIDREDVVDLLIASVALEEIGLAHIINSEAEKIQSVLGTLEGSPRENPPTVDELLDINDSVRSTLKDIIKKEMLLEFKLEDAITLINMQEDDDDGNGEDGGDNGGDGGDGGNGGGGNRPRPPRPPFGNRSRHCRYRY